MKKHIYIYEKVITIVLSFVMIAGLLGGMKLDARAEEQVIDEVEIKVKDPVPGQSFPGVNDVSVITPTDKIVVTNIEWWNYNNTPQVVAQGSSVEYNTKYMVSVWLQAKDNYKFADDITKKIKKTINGSSENISNHFEQNKKVLYVTHNFSATAPDPAKTINSVNITIAPPVAGQPFATTCEVSTQGVRVSGIRWYYTDERGDASTLAEYNTEYAVNVLLDSETNYKFAPAYEIKATVNGQNNTQPQDISQRSIYVRYVFPATDPKPSSGDYKIIEGNDSNYVPGSDKPLSFRGDGEFNEFLRVEVDGKIVEEKYYTKEAGSTIITFTPEYLATLSEGSHTVKMVWGVNGEEKSATASFHIGEKSGEVVPGNTGTTQPADNTESEPRHICSFEWVITLDPTTGADGLEEYKCTGCGVVQESHPIPASVAVVKDFYGKVKEAPEKGSITYDSGKLYTISDYILKKMAERNDVAVTVKFEYQNKKYQIIFPAGLDYSAVLNDEETMYGYFGAAAKLGLKVTGQ